MTTRRRTKQKGHLYRENGFWVVRYRCDRVIDGGLRRVRIARQLAPIAGTNKTRARELADELLADVNKPKLQPQTLRGYKVILEDQLQPFLVDGKLRPLWLRDLDTPEAQRILDKLAETGRLGKSSLQHVKAFLSGVFRFAINQKYYPNNGNPMKCTTLPTARAPEQTYAYTLEEIFGMLAVLPEPAATVVAMAAFAGLRRGEVRGARWERYADGELMIAESVWQSFITEPKSEESKASVPIIPALAQRLELHHARQSYPTAGSIFPNERGKPADLNNLLARVIQPALKKAGIEWHGWHAFRRGLATNLKQLGVDDLTIQRILRHSNVGVTQKCYIKTRDEQVHAAMDKLQAAIETQNSLLASGWPAKTVVQ